MKKTTLVIILFAVYTSLFSQNCNQLFTGEGTFYGYGGGGNCSYSNPTSPVYTGAMNEAQYDTSLTCGACVEVNGSKGSLVIRIEDRCPECKYGDIDLSEEAFLLIDDKIKGRVPISWKFVPCPVQGAIKFYFKEGSSRWWTAVQIRNHKYPVTKLEYKVNDHWINIQRVMYNYFLVESGMGPGPFSFRITDMYGHIIEENNIPLLVTTEINGQNQFPNCDGGSVIPVTGVTILPTAASLASGATTQLTATISPSDATNKIVTWSSSNTAVATVNTNGLITGISEGSATIEAKTQDGGKTAQCVITVIKSSSCSFGTPSAVALPTISKSYTSVYILGTNNPILSNMNNFVINWNLPNNGLYQFSITTKDGNPNWYVDLIPKATQSFASALPAISLSGTGITGLDGNYWAIIDNDNFVLVSKTGEFSIYFSNSSTAPDCVQYALQISGLTEQGSFAWYPNPFVYETRLISESKTIKSIEVYNELGKKILYLEKKTIDSAPVKLGINLPSGIYIVKVYQQNRSKIYKLIKQ